MNVLCAVHIVRVEGGKDELPGGMVSTKGSIGIFGETEVIGAPFSQVSLTELSAYTLSVLA